MTTFDLLLLATALLGAGAAALAYGRSRDPFHPLVIACPITVFIYVYLPWSLRADSRFEWFVPREGLVKAQVVFLALFAAFCLGALAASGRTRWARQAPPELSRRTRVRLTVAAAVVGAAGLASWALLVAWEGGLGQVYDQPHGGDVLHPSGWVRESTRLALVGLVLALAASRSWRSCALAGVLAGPQLLHAILGTRRGPAFVVAVIGLVGWYVFEGRRPRFLAALGGGAALGLAILLLLANRSRLYYASEAPLTLDVTDSIAFYANAGNDYVVAAALVVTADRTGSFGWGRSYIEQLLLRPIPRSLLPNKYDIIEKGTVGDDDIASTLGWQPPPGWAPTLFAHLYIEFGWLALLASGLLGAAYGAVWRRAVTSSALSWRVAHVLMSAGILHLVAQEVWAMAVPFLLMCVPAWLVLRWSVGPSRAARPTAGWAGAAGLGRAP